MTADLPKALQEFEEAMPSFAGYMYRRVSKYLGTRVLDAGAGAGTYGEMLLNEGRQVVAIESDPALLQVLHSRLDGPGAEVYGGDLASPDGLPSFEAVDSSICLNVLEHIEDDRKALANIRERLRPGGTLVVLVPAHPVLYNHIDKAVGHYRRYRRAQLLDTLRQTGWQVGEITYFNAPSILAWFIAGKVLRKDVPGKSLSRFGDTLMPFLNWIDKNLIRGSLGISLIAVATKPAP